MAAVLLRSVDGGLDVFPSGAALHLLGNVARENTDVFFVVVFFAFSVCTSARFERTDPFCFLLIRFF